MFWTGLRRSIAQLLLGLFIGLFVLIAYAAWQSGEPAVARVFLLLAACYGLAFLGLGGEWFWARWFAMGVGNFGALSLVSIFKMGLVPEIVFFGGSHLFITVLLWGPHMAERYELKHGWRERLKLQESSVEMLRNAVVSAGMTIPWLILALLPTPDGMAWLRGLPLLFAGAALVGLVRRRTWGVLALGATAATAGVAALASLGLLGGEVTFGITHGEWVTGGLFLWPVSSIIWGLSGTGLFVASVVAAAGFVLFVPSMMRYVLGRRPAVRVRRV
jgi:hypothetical protein